MLVLGDIVYVFEAFPGVRLSASTTIMEPLSAFLMTMSSRLPSRSRAMRSSLVRFWNIFRFGLVSSSARRVLEMSSSRAAFFVLGGSHFDGLLNGVVPYAWAILLAIVWSVLPG